MPRVFTASSAVSSYELTRLAGAVDGSYVFPLAAGGAPTAAGGNLTVNLAAVIRGMVVANSVTDSTGAAAGSTTLSTADASNPRRDIVWYDVSNGAFGNTAGTAVASAATTGPVLPSITASRIAICEVAVGAGVTAITAGNITDMRQASTGTPPEIVIPLMPVGTTTTNTTLTQNSAYFIPIVPVTAPTVVTTLNWYHSTASGNYDIGIYAFDGTTMTRIVSLGTTASPAIGANRVASNITDTTLYPGARYYFAFAADNGTESLDQTNAVPHGITNIGFIKATSFPLPATAGTLTNSAITVPIYGVVSGGVVA